MIREGIIIRNTNGYEYKVLEDLGSYTLLERTIGGCEPFIVAWGLKEFEKGWSWGQGYYFSKKDDAKRCFDKKVGVSHE